MIISYALKVHMLRGTILYGIPWYVNYWIKYQFVVMIIFYILKILLSILSVKIKYFALQNRHAYMVIRNLEP